MKKFLKGAVIAGVIFISACAALSAVQTTAQACGIYSSTLVTLSTYKDQMTDAQIKTVDQAVAILGPICEGNIPTGDAADLALVSLDSLEALLLELQGAK